MNRRQFLVAAGAAMAVPTEVIKAAGLEPVYTIDFWCLKNNKPLGLRVWNHHAYVGSKEYIDGKLCEQIVDDLDVKFDELRVRRGRHEVCIAHDPADEGGAPPVS